MHTTPNWPHLCYAIDNVLYLNISDRCTLKCEFCPKTNGTTKIRDYELALKNLPSAEDVIEQLPENLHQFEEVVFCGYGESTLRLQVLIPVAKHLKRNFVRTRLNTDGLGNLAHRRNILPDLSRLIDAISISLNAQNQEVYDRICQPAFKDSYRALLEFIELAPKYISEVQISAINGLEGVDIAECKRIAEQYNVSFKQRELDVLA